MRRVMVLVMQTTTQVSKRRWSFPLIAAVAFAILTGTVTLRPALRADADHGAGAEHVVGVSRDTGGGSSSADPHVADLVAGIEARAYAVYDPATGVFLAARDLDGRRSVGSLMKLLTAKVAIDAGEPDRVVKIPSLDLRSDESKVGLIAGEEQRRDVLLRAMLIASANDAARSLAIDIGGGIPEFVEEMNRTAKELGMHHTHAVDPAGLDARAQYSSARDMVLLGELLMRDPGFRATVARREARLHGDMHAATNDLLGSYLGADGVKTGYTDEAGWCLLASATRDDRRIYAIVLGAPSEKARDRDATRLLDWGFAMRSGD